MTQGQQFAKTLRVVEDRRQEAEAPSRGRKIENDELTTDSTREHRHIYEHAMKLRGDCKNENTIKSWVC